MNHSLFDLSGRTALVTGASAGIGRTIAVALGSAGARVVLVARRVEALAKATGEVAVAGGLGAPLVADLTDPDIVENLAKRATQAFGPIEILVNAAGINLRESPENITQESWAQTLNLNLSVPFFLARSLVRGMQHNGRGKIINIASLQSQRAFADGMAYGASKAGLCQLTRAMAEAWSKHAIGCNAIAPGFFPTQLTQAVMSDPERAARLAHQTAIGRNGNLEDLHGAAIFLAAPASDYITGQTLFVDGGFTAK